MVIIRFPDRKSFRRGVGFLAGRFSGRVFSTRAVIVPEEAIPELVRENLSFTVLGKPTYEQMVLPGVLLKKRRALP
jgi:hypothetical protein